MRALLGTFTFSLIMLNTFICASLVIIFGIIVWCLQPIKPLYRCCLRWLHLLPVSWSMLNFAFLRMATIGKWDIEGSGDLSTKQWYMMISNHQTWADIVVLGGIFAAKVPVLKFFMKKELLWSLPFAGLACYLLGYPFMERHSRADIRKNPALKGKDIETAKKACGKFRLVPTTVINFLEGTRFTQAKREQQDSPYKHLLKPKAGGVAIVINEMKDTLSGILDVTINYDAEQVTFWNIVCGRINKITVRYRVIPIPAEAYGNYYEDRIYRAQFQKWLNDIWEHKDQLISR